MAIGISALFVPGPATAATNDLDLVSWPDEFLPQGFDYREAEAPSTSSDGRFISFTSSYAPPEFAESDPAYRDVFVRDMVSGETRLVSAIDGGNDEAGNADSWEPTISDDGRYVVFLTAADNLTSDPVGDISVFRRDLSTATTILIATGADVGSPTISADGNRVAFERSEQAFVRDVSAATTTLVSRKDGAAGAMARNSAKSPVITSDGSKVVFQSQDNLDGTPEQFYGVGVFVRDLNLNSTVRASRANGPDGAPVPTVSHLRSSVSPDGRFVAFVRAGDPWALGDFDRIMLRDMRNGTTTTVSRAGGVLGPDANDHADSPTVSADGARVAFQSRANNLVPDDTNDAYDVFVHDLPSATTALASRGTGSSGVIGERGSYGPTISEDGHYVTFLSFAEALSAEDDFEAVDVFRRDLDGGNAPSITGPTPPGPPRTDPPDRSFSFAVPSVPEPIHILPKLPPGAVSYERRVRFGRPIKYVLSCQSGCRPAINSSLMVDNHKLRGMRTLKTQLIGGRRNQTRFKLYFSFSPRAKKSIGKALRRGKHVVIFVNAIFGSPPTAENTNSKSIILLPPRRRLPLRTPLRRTSYTTAD
ncbi:MAG: hypothetical protein WAP37_05295 [Solirubrobacterales bacterium]